MNSNVRVRLETVCLSSLISDLIKSQLILHFIIDLWILMEHEAVDSQEFVTLAPSTTINLIIRFQHLMEFSSYPPPCTALNVYYIIFATI